MVGFARRLLTGSTISDKLSLTLAAELLGCTFTLASLNHHLNVCLLYHTQHVFVQNDVTMTLSISTTNVLPLHLTHAIIIRHCSFLLYASSITPTASLSLSLLSLIVYKC